MGDFLPGKLVYLDIAGREYSEESFLMIYRDIRTNKTVLHEAIDIFSFPSFKDFKGDYYEVSHGDPCIVLKKVGRPLKITDSNNWNDYDVYEVLYEKSKILQVFKYIFVLQDGERIKRNILS